MADIIRAKPEEITIIPPHKGTLRTFVGDAFSTWMEKVGIVLTVLPFIETIPAVSAWLHGKPFIEDHLWFLWLVGGFCIVWGFYEAYRKQFEAREKAEQVPTEIKVDILDFHHRPETGDVEETALNIFIKSSVELLRPKTAEVEYKLSLILPNSTATRKSENDIELWGMRAYEADSSGREISVMIHRNSIDALPTGLFTKDKKEGWLHFKFIPVGMETLKVARIRLSALTPHGGGHDEQPVLDARWPLFGRNQSIVKARTEEWLNLPEEERRLRLGRFGEYDGKL